MEADHVAQYLAELKRRDYTEGTRAVYGRTVRRFARWMEGLPIEQITPEDVLLFTRTRAAKSTQSYRETHLRGFFDWHVEQGTIPVSPLAKVGHLRRPRPEDLDVLTLSTEQVRRLLDFSYTLQEKLCVYMLVFTGARLSAVSNARWIHVDPCNETITFREKGNKEITKPVPTLLMKLLAKAWKHSEHMMDYIVPSDAAPRNEKRDPRIIGRILFRVARRAGVPVHPHVLRASFAVAYLEENPGDLIALKALMGHSDLGTTEIYLRRLDRRNAMERVRSLTYHREDA